MQYKLDEGETDAVWHIYGESDSMPAATLRGGTAAAIARVYKTLARHSPEKAADYLAGVLAGVRHIQAVRLSGHNVWVVSERCAAVYADKCRADDAGRRLGLAPQATAIR